MKGWTNNSFLFPSVHLVYSQECVLALETTARFGAPLAPL